MRADLTALFVGEMLFSETQYFYMLATKARGDQGNTLFLSSFVENLTPPAEAPHLFPWRAQSHAVHPPSQLAYLFSGLKRQGFKIPTHPPLQVGQPQSSSITRWSSAYRPSRRFTCSLGTTRCRFADPPPPPLWFLLPTPRGDPSSLLPSTPPPETAPPPPAAASASSSRWRSRSQKLALTRAPP